MSDPTFADIDFNNKMDSVWTTLNLMILRDQKCYFYSWKWAFPGKNDAIFARFFNKKDQFESANGLFLSKMTIFRLRLLFLSGNSHFFQRNTSPSRNRCYL